MAVLIPDETTKFPLQEIKYLDISLNDLFTNMLEYKRAIAPDWTDESASDFGIRLLWLFSVLSNWNVDNMERVKNNSYIALTQDREAMKYLCQLINYQLGTATAASGTATFTLESGHPEFTIPIGTQIGTKETEELSRIFYETSQSQIVLVGVTEIDVPITNGETFSDEILGSSDGTILQIFTIPKKPIIYDSETIEVNDGSWSAWTRVDNLVDSQGADEHYRVIIDEDDNYKILFGTGENGKIPVAGTNNIRATYRQGGGEESNVDAGYITELISSVNYVESVTNAAATSGGSDKETLEHARVYAPASLRNLERAVTTQDIEALSNTFNSPVHGGIATSKAFEVGGVSISVMIVPRAGGLPTSGLKAELQTYLDERRMAATSINVIDPVYEFVTVTATVYALPNYVASVVADNVRRGLVSYIAPNYQDPRTGLYPHTFGRNIYLSDLYRIIDEAAGVDYGDITVPTANIIVADYKIADVDSINLDIVIPGAGTVSYQDIAEEGIV